MEILGKKWNVWWHLWKSTENVVCIWQRFCDFPVKMKRVKRVKTPRISWWLAPLLWWAWSSHHQLIHLFDFLQIVHLFYILFSALFMFVVQVCRQLGHSADHHWDVYGHNHWGNVSHQFYCVWKADGHFYRELQDVLPQHQRPQSVFTCRHLHEHSKSMCYVLAFLSSRLCFLCFSLMSDLTSVRNNTLQDEMRG